MNIEKEIADCLEVLKESMTKKNPIFTIKGMDKLKIFKKLFVSFESREVKIEGVPQSKEFLIIHEIELYPEFKSYGIFSNIIDFLKVNKQDVWIDDIVNNRLFGFLHKKDYQNVIYKSKYGWTSCMFTINK